MKTILKLLVVLTTMAGCVTWAYPPYPATQATVNRGVEPYAYVTPKTLASWAPTPGSTNGYYQTNLINDTTVISIVSNTITSPLIAANWNQEFADVNMTNFQLCGTYTPLRQSGPFGVYNFPNYIQTGTAGPAQEITYGANYSFQMDGNQFVVRIGGAGFTWGFAVNGVMNGYANTMPNDGNEWWYTITFATSAKRTITMYNAWPVYSVYVGITNNFIPNRGALTHTLAVLGDSWFEQAYNGPAGCQGIGCQLQNMRPDLCVISLGEGGTGFYANGAASFVTNYTARVPDIVACNPEYVLLWGSVNDQGWATNTSITNGIYVNATNVMFQLKARLPNTSIMEIGPQNTQTPTAQAFLNLAILYSNACVAASIPYVNPLNQPWITGLFSTPNSGNANSDIDPGVNHPLVPTGTVYLAAQVNAAIQSMSSGLYPNDRRPVALTNAANVFSGKAFSSYAVHLPVTVTVGASPFSFTNNNSTAIECYTSGSVAYSVAKNGAAVFGSLAGDGYMTLQPASYLTITYSVAPTLSTNAW